MINFRFHLVSLIAVFLAVGLGILVGSTVVDQVIVDRLEKKISEVRHDNSQTKKQNHDLSDALSQLREFMSKSEAYTVEGRLEGVSVVVVAERGIDGSVLKSMRSTLDEAGADTPGVLWLGEGWRLDDPKQLQTLENAIGATGNAASVRVQAMQMLAARVAEPPAESSASSNDVLSALVDAHFIDVTDGDRNALTAFPSRATRALVVTGDDSRLIGTDTLVDLVRALVDAKVPTVVSAAYDGKSNDATPPERGAALAPVSGNDELTKVVSTLDDLDLAQGPATAVIALERIADGTVGRYGYGTGASRPLPARP